MEEISITCEEAKEVEIGFEGKEPVIADDAWNCITTPIIPRIFVTACKDEAADVWKRRIAGAERRSGNVGGNLSVPLS